MEQHKWEQRIRETIHTQMGKIEWNKTPATFLQAYMACHSNVELLIEELSDTHHIKHTACRPGCSWCCCLPVAAQAYEVVFIAEYLKRFWDPLAFRQIKKRMKAYLKSIQSRKPSKTVLDWIPCPFLEQNYCTIYFVRPINCQAHNSDNEHTCWRISKGDPEIMQFEPLRKEIYSLAFHTMKKSFKNMNMDTSHVNFIEGLAKVLNIPNQTEKYLDQERLF